MENFIFCAVKYALFKKLFKELVSLRYELFVIILELLNRFLKVLIENEISLLSLKKVNYKLCIYPGYYRLFKSANNNGKFLSVPAIFLKFCLQPITPKSLKISST